MAYLYRAIDKGGDTIDFSLSPTRNTKAATRFLGKALKALKDWEMPVKINTDKAPTYGPEIAELKKAGKLPDETQHRQVKYLNNVVAADHSKLRQLIRPARGFKSLKTGLRHHQGVRGDACTAQGTGTRVLLAAWNQGEVRLVERAFGLGPSALVEAAQIVADHCQMAA